MLKFELSLCWSLNTWGGQVRAVRPLLGVIRRVEGQEYLRVRSTESHERAILVQGAGGVARVDSIVEVDAGGCEELPDGQGGVQGQVEGLVEGQDV